MAQHDCTEPPSLTQGFSVYAIHIAPRDHGGYEWRVIRSSKGALRGAATPEGVSISHGTARGCEEAQRKSVAARTTVMAQYHPQDIYRSAM